MPKPRQCRFCRKGSEDTLLGTLAQYATRSYAHLECIIRCKGVVPMRCNKCRRAMKGSTSYDGTCACGGLIEVGFPSPSPAVKLQQDELEQIATSSEAEYEARR